MLKKQLRGLAFTGFSLKLKSLGFLPWEHTGRDRLKSLPFRSL